MDDAHRYYIDNIGAPIIGSLKTIDRLSVDVKKKRTWIGLFERNL